VRIAILDGYCDEPSLLGVPPYISPYPRLLAGAVEEAGHGWLYITADEARAAGIVPGQSTLPAPGARERARGKAAVFRKCELLAITGGASVPGKYLRGMPLSVNEIATAASAFSGEVLLGGPLARFSPGEVERFGSLFAHIAKLDAESSLFDRLKGGRWADRERTAEEEDRWAVKGARVVSEHPDHPRPLMVELSLYRGCVRHHTGGCLFCTDILYGKPVFREPAGVLAEVAALSRRGAVNFRLGGASCLFSYRAKGVGRTETPTPDPDVVRGLLRGIWKAAPSLEVLHTDNANPAVIAEHPGESREILEAIVERCTGGNALSLGLESADPAVLKANNLNSTAGQALDAIRLINEVGNRPSPTGLPALLPGLNFLCGLKGELPATYEMNYEFLKKVVSEGLLLRRINIRQVMPTRHRFGPPVFHSEFLRFKERVRKEVDRPMLLRLVPAGTVLRDVFPEVALGKLTFCRQTGTYPLLVAVPGLEPGGPPADVAIIDHGERSATGLPHPVRLNRLSLYALSLIPGIGKKRAARLAVKRPFKGFDEAAAALDEPDLLAPLKNVLRFD
jgi:radical SAM superfamily enzyme with C-terminal helix-hairpin-helix motif